MFPVTSAGMIKLYSLKPQNKDGSSSQSGAGGKKATAAQLRVTKGLNKTGNVILV